MTVRADPFDNHLPIGAVAERSGLAVSAIRFYESKGLVSSERTDGGQRRFRRDVLRRLAFIQAAQQVGLTLDEIGEALSALPDHAGPTPQQWGEMSARWRPVLDERIRLLERLRSDLEECIGCGCLSVASCRLRNPGDRAHDLGPGARYLLGDAPPTEHGADIVAAMTIDSDDDLEGVRRAGAVVAEARDAALAVIRPGTTTGELDAVAREVLRRHGARSAPRLAYDFPGTICVSVNHEAAHGIPSATRTLAEGDLVNVDVSAELDGYWADTGASAPVGRVSTTASRLLDATRLANRDALRVARAGRPLRHIGRAVERRARKHGFTVVADLSGHGVGRHIHEAPSVPNVEHRRDRTVLWEGLVLAVEPFLSVSATSTWTDRDGWTLCSNDGSLTAQFEHTIVVTNGEPLVMTASAAAA